MMPREVSWRIFSEELNHSLPLPKGTEEFSPHYVITPLGAKVNRVFIVGVLSDVVNVGSEEEPLWRARVTDPSGVFYLSAGQYQPEASQVIASLAIPSFIAVVGKTRVYSPEEGINYVSIRPESVKKVDKELRDQWVIEAAESTFKRIEAMKSALEMEGPTLDNLTSLGISEKVAKGLLNAIETHGRADVNRFARMVADALAFVEPELEELPEVGFVTAGTGEPAGPPPKEDAKAEEDVLAIVKELAVDGGILYDEVLESAKAKGIERIDVEEAVNSLMDKGMIFEPFLGKLSIVDE